MMPIVTEAVFVLFSDFSCKFFVEKTIEFYFSTSEHGGLNALLVL